MTAPPPDDSPREDDAPSWNAGQADAWGAVSLLGGGLVFWGGVGWLVSRWLNNTVFLMLGLLLGMGGALYLVWLRYGRS
jgi:ATP synthase protein I